jgi:hypothetical protein
VTSLKSLISNQVDECDRGAGRGRSIDGQRQLAISALDKAVELTNESRRSAAEILKVLIRFDLILLDLMALSLPSLFIPIVVPLTFTHLSSIQFL